MSGLIGLVPPNRLNGGAPCPSGARRWCRSSATGPPRARPPVFVCTAFSPQAPRRPRPAAFTIAELLVVITIIIILIALLLPWIRRIRQDARDLVCVTRLRDLTEACAVYYKDHGRYPAPPRVMGSGGRAVVSVTVPGLGPVRVGKTVPQDINLRLLNDLSSYLRYPALRPGTPIEDLPPAVQCPSVEDEDGGRGPYVMADGSSQAYYTGYVYVGRINEAPNLVWNGTSLRVAPGSAGGLTSYGSTPPRLLSGAGATVPDPGSLSSALPGVTTGLTNPPGGNSTGLLPPGILPALPPLAAVPANLGVVLKPARSARKPGGRDVLWADNVSLFFPPDGSGRYWQFAHPHSWATEGSRPLTYSDPTACRGQHRGYSDGSVDWIKAENLGLEPNATGAGPDPGPSYRADGGYWWY